MVNEKLFFDSKISQSEIQKLYDEIDTEVNSGEIGYYHLPDDKAMAKSIREFCDNNVFLQTEVKNVVVVGIGGSSLGAKAIDWMLYHKKNRRDINYVFLENVDPNEFNRKLLTLKQYETFFIFVSKSGTTIETISIMKYVLERFGMGIDSWALQDHSAIITDEGSALDKLAQKYNLTTFHIPKNVGGRFSALSAVGMLPLYIAGYDIDSLQEGARYIKKEFAQRKKDNIIKKAYHYATNYEKTPINVLFSYASAFNDFNDWFVQLWAESLGKIDSRGERVGLTPVGLIGSIDQHSFLQLIIEGPKDKTVTMLKVKDFQNDMKIPNLEMAYLESTDIVNNQTFETLINAQCDATMHSIIDQGISVDLIELSKFDEFNAGYLIYYFELLTSVTGKILGINTYNQPGVELGKKILREKFEKKSVELETTFA